MDVDALLSDLPSDFFDEPCLPAADDDWLAAVPDALLGCAALPAAEVDRRVFSFQESPADLLRSLVVDGVSFGAEIPAPSAPCLRALLGELGDPGYYCNSNSPSGVQHVAAAASLCSQTPVCLRVLVAGVSAEYAAAQPRPVPHRCIRGWFLQSSPRSDDASGVRVSSIVLSVSGDWLAACEHLIPGKSIVHVIPSVDGTAFTFQDVHAPSTGSPVRTPGRLLALQSLCSAALTITNTGTGIADRQYQFLNFTLASTAVDPRIAALVLSSLESHVREPVRMPFFRRRSGGDLDYSVLLSSLGMVPTDARPLCSEGAAQAHGRALRAKFAVLFDVMTANTASTAPRSVSAVLMSAVISFRSPKAAYLLPVLFDFVADVLDTHALASLSNDTDVHAIVLRNFVRYRREALSFFSGAESLLETSWAALVAAAIFVITPSFPASTDCHGSPMCFASVGARNNAIIMHPDILLAPTKIASVFTCMRRAVLSELYGDSGNTGFGEVAAASAAPLLGNLKHELFQLALNVACSTNSGAMALLQWRMRSTKDPAVRAQSAVFDSTGGASKRLCLVKTDESRNASSVKDGVRLVHYIDDEQQHACQIDGCFSRVELCLMLRDHAHDIVHAPARIRDLLACSMTDAAAFTELSNAIPGIVDWLHCYVGLPHSESHPLSYARPFRLMRVVGIEDAIWSPVWGLKGIVDATVDVQLTPPGCASLIGARCCVDHGGRTTQESCAQERWPVVRVPWELKTGKRPANGVSVDHRAQLALYSLLLRERYADTTDLALPVTTRNELCPQVAGAAPLPPCVGEAARRLVFKSPWVDMGAWADSTASYRVGSESVAASSALGSGPLVGAAAQATASATAFRRDVSRDVSAESAVGAIIVYLTNLSVGTTSGSAVSTLPVVTLEAESTLSLRRAAAVTRSCTDGARSAPGASMTSRIFFASGYAPSRSLSAAGRGQLVSASANGTKSVTFCSGPTSAWNPAHYTASVPALWLEQRPLLAARNSLACAIAVARDAHGVVLDCAPAQSVREEVAVRPLSTPVRAVRGGNPKLPPLQQSVRLCTSCFMMTTCATVYAARELPCAGVKGFEDLNNLHGDKVSEIPLVSSISQGLQSLYEVALGHLAPGTVASSYAADWFAAIDWESFGVRSRRGGTQPVSAIDMEDAAGGVCKTGAASIPDTRWELPVARPFWFYSATEKEISGTGVANLVLISQRPSSTSSDPAVSLENWLKFTMLSHRNRHAGIAGPTSNIGAAPDDSDHSEQFEYLFATYEYFLGQVAGVNTADVKVTARPTLVALGKTRGSGSSAGKSAELGSVEGLRIGSYVFFSGQVCGPYAMLAGELLSVGGNWLAVRGRRDVLSAFPSSFAQIAFSAASASTSIAPCFLWRLDVRDAGLGFVSRTAEVQKGNVIRLVLGNAAPHEALADEVRSDDIASRGRFAAHTLLSSVAQGSGAVVDNRVVCGSPDVWDDSALAAAECEAFEIAAAAGARSEAGNASFQVSLPFALRSGDVRRQNLLITLSSPRFWHRPMFPWDDQTCAAPVPPSSSAEWQQRRIVAYVPVHTTSPPSRAFVGHSSVAAFRQRLYREYADALNDDQRAAVAKIFCARDYALVLGMPGSGKSSTIALAVQALLAAGKSVVVTSHTHSAVDTLLAKLMSAGVDVLRIGAPASVSPEVRGACLDVGIADGRYPDVGHVRHRMMNAPVVGVTCLGIDGHPLFSQRLFDVAICDEAGQIPEPIALGSVRIASAFVLIGDHAQLPPLVLSPAAAAAGMGVSLLQRLAEAHPAATVRLTTQYRMNADIMSIANALVYQGALRCASDAVATQRYLLPRPTAASSHIAPVLPGVLPPPLWTLFPYAEVGSGVPLLASPPWLRHVLDPAATVTLLDTDTLFDGCAQLAGSTSCSCSVDGALRCPTTESGYDVAAGPSDRVIAAAAGPSMTVAAEAAVPVPPRVSCCPCVPCDGEGSVANGLEAAVLVACVAAILFHGGLGADIGIIAPFNAQVLEVRRRLECLREALTGTGVGSGFRGCAGAFDAGTKGPAAEGEAARCAESISQSLMLHVLQQLPEVEVETIDRYQGRDKQVVLMTFTRAGVGYRLQRDGEYPESRSTEPLSLARGVLGSLARLNVAFTRAKAKLVMVGSAATLCAGSPVCAALIGHCASRGWMCPIQRSGIRQQRTSAHPRRSRATCADAAVSSASCPCSCHW